MLDEGGEPFWIEDPHVARFLGAILDKPPRKDDRAPDRKSPARAFRQQVPEPRGECTDLPHGVPVWLEPIHQDSLPIELDNPPPRLDLL